MTGRGKLVAGPTLILMGVLLLAGHSVHWQTFGVLWLFLFLAAGLVLLGLYAQGRRHPSILAGGVLVTLLALHLLSLRWGWVSFERTWPFFLLAPGLALLAVASSDRGNKDALSPAIVLIGMAVFCYLFTLGIFALILKILLGLVRFAVKYLLPVVLIGWGVWLVLDRRRQSVADENAGVAPAPEVSVKVEEYSVEDPVTGENERITVVHEAVEPEESVEEAEITEVERPEEGGFETPDTVPENSELERDRGDDSPGPRFT